MSKIIRQTVTIKASPKDVYEALMDSKKHSTFTGRTAKISRKVGGTFMAHEGYIEGINLELIPNQKIVQSWHANEMNWPDRYFSTVTFTLSKVKGGTKITFSHAGVPDEYREPINQGWKDYYWKPLKDYLEK